MKAKEKVLVLEQVLVDTDTAFRSVAIHFSEDPKKLKLCECFSIFAELIDKIEVARKENETRQKQEERAARLAAEKAILAASPQGSLGRPSGKKILSSKMSSTNDDICIVDRLLGEIRRGEFKLKKSRSG